MNHCATEARQIYNESDRQHRTKPYDESCLTDISIEHTKGRQSSHSPKIQVRWKPNIESNLDTQKDQLSQQLLVHKHIVVHD